MLFMLYQSLTRRHPSNTRIQLTYRIARTHLHQTGDQTSGILRTGTSLGQHVIHGGRGQHRVPEAHRVHVEQTQVQQRYTLHVVFHIELLLLAADQLTGVRAAVLVHIERHDYVCVVLPVPFRQLAAAAQERVVVNGRYLQISHQPSVGRDRRYLPAQRLQHEQLKLRDGLFVVVAIVFHVTGELFQLRRIDLFHFGRKEQRSHADQLKTVHFHLLLALGHEPVQVLHGQVQGLSVQAVRVGDLGQPVEQNRSHLLLDAQVSPQIQMVVGELGVLAAHYLPQIVAVRPCEPGHGALGRLVGWQVRHWA
ncbi:hypothetical protein BpHYR1_039442, partial [Brachionus plicatilis]